MGRIKTRVIKRFTEELFRQHSDKFTNEYAKNKAIVGQFAVINSAKLNNIIAGYVTKLVKLKKREE